MGALRTLQPGHMPGCESRWNPERQRSIGRSSLPVKSNLSDFTVFGHLAAPKQSASVHLHSDNVGYTRRTSTPRSCKEAIAGVVAFVSVISMWISETGQIRAGVTTPSLLESASTMACLA